MDKHRDEEIVTNEKGGKQSDVHYRMDLLPAEALLSIANTLKTGAEKYGDWNWKLLDANDHLNHALIHITVFFSCNSRVENQVEELSHAATRLMFALETIIEENKKYDEL